MTDIITPNWPASNAIQAFTTTRYGGVSEGTYESFNLARHVGDNPEHVLENRRRLRKNYELPEEPLWLQQNHSSVIISSEEYNDHQQADGCYTKKPLQPLVIMSADCLPILITDNQGTQIMALHGGWRGLAAGIIEAGIDLFKTAAKDLLVWLGPAISSENYEVGEDVKAQFMRHYPEVDHAFSPSTHGRWLMSLVDIAKHQCVRLGVDDQRIYGGHHCTYGEKELFFSHRRDGQAGRMATIIYRK